MRKTNKELINVPQSTPKGVYVKGMNAKPAFMNTFICANCNSNTFSCEQNTFLLFQEKGR